MADVSRRQFLKIGAGTGAGLMIGIQLTGCSPGSGDDKSTGKAFQPNAWLKISPDNTVTVIVNESEMGQGVMTSLPMLVAEELEVDWSTVRFEHAPVGPAYGFQTTGGSTSIRHAWLPLREAGAIAREMLITAAAQTWKVPEKECRAQNSMIIHAGTGKKLSYGELVEAASKLPVPEIVLLKEPEDFNIIGKNKTLLDTPQKVDGSAIFASDVTLPELLVATISHCPVFGGTVQSVDDSETKKIAGVKHVLPFEDSVAVVADNFWAAKKGQDALKIKWNDKGNDSLDSQTIHENFKAAVGIAGEVLRADGDFKKGLSRANKIIEATYEPPFEAHATMEPMNCVAHVRDGECDIWAPTQSPNRAQETAANVVLSKPGKLLEKIKGKLTGENLNSIRIHTPFLGGGFGRRLEQDFVAEAVQISKAVGKPVKLVWTREEDMQHDFYRPYTYHKLTAGLDTSGNPVAWEHRVVGPSKGKSTGGAVYPPYAIPNFHFEYIKSGYAVPTGSWRSVGSSHNAFIIESFIDELAFAAGKDPLDYRIQLLSDSSRHLDVLKLAAEKADWGKPMPSGRYRGIALHESFGSFVAQVAEISINNNKQVRVHRVVCAIDCGIVVNPDTVRAQMDSAIVFGLTATLKSSITIQNGRVKQANFHDFSLLRIDEMPQIETHIAPSREDPGGVGEPGVPPIAAAVANAVFSATGIRVRKLPILPEDLKLA